MRLLLAAVALATVMIPAPAPAQTSMSNGAAMPPTMATYACRKSSDKDTSPMMEQNHEISATTSDGTKLVCMALVNMHEKMMAEKASAAKMKDASAASEIWVDYVTRYLSVPF